VEHTYPTYHEFGERMGRGGEVEVVDLGKRR
jgi:hypothetical protein